MGVVFLLLQCSLTTNIERKTGRRAQSEFSSKAVKRKKLLLPVTEWTAWLSRPGSRPPWSNQPSYFRSLAANPSNEWNSSQEYYWIYVVVVVEFYCAIVTKCAGIITHCGLQLHVQFVQRTCRIMWTSDLYKALRAIWRNKTSTSIRLLKTQFSDPKNPRLYFKKVW